MYIVRDSVAHKKKTRLTRSSKAAFGETGKSRHLKQSQKRILSELLTLLRLHADYSLTQNSLRKSRNSVNQARIKKRRRSIPKNTPRHYTGAHKKVIPEITIMASVRRGW